MPNVIIDTMFDLIAILMPRSIPPSKPSSTRKSITTMIPESITPSKPGLIPPLIPKVTPKLKQTRPELVAQTS